MFCFSCFFSPLLITFITRTSTSLRCHRSTYSLLVTRLAWLASLKIESTATATTIIQRGGIFCWRRWGMELISCDAGEQNTDSLDKCQQHSTDNCRSGHGWHSVTCSQDSTGCCARDNRIPGVLFLPEVH